MGKGPDARADDTLPTNAGAPLEAQLAPDTRAGGRYRIVRFLAAGGSGEVFEAEDLVLGGRVALKALHSGMLGTPHAVERFRREAALARRVSHRNVCRLHDVGEHQGRIFLTMELLAGETLAVRISRGPLGAAEMTRITEQLVAGLAALHAAGVIHRDLKPSNVILDGDRVVVTDFGLARWTGISAQDLTAETALLGTPAYMAPEQVEGRKATPATDIYALGLILYEMAVGERAFHEETAMATAIARLTRDPPRAREQRPDLAPSLDETIARCLAREPAARFARVEDVLAPPPPVRHGWIVAAAIAALLALAAVAAALILDIRPRGDPPLQPARFLPADPRAATLAERAHARLAVDDWATARELLQQAVAIAPDDPIAQGRLAEVLAALGFEERANAARAVALRGIDALDGEPRAWLEAQDASARGDHATAIARYRELIEYAPAELGYRRGLIDELFAAGDVSAVRAAIDDARAIPGDVARIQLDLAEAMLGGPDALDLAIRSAELAHTHGRQRDEARANEGQAFWLWKRGDTAAAGTAYERGIPLAGAVGDAGLVLTLQRGVLDVWANEGRFVRRAEGLADEIILARALGNRRVLVDLLTMQGMALTDLGRVAEAEAAAREGLAIGEELDDNSARSVARSTLGRIAKHRGQLADALVQLVEARRLAALYGQGNILDLATGHLDDVLDLLGSDHTVDPDRRRFARDEASVRAALAAPADPIQRAEDQASLARLLVARGDLAGAQAAVDAAGILGTSGSMGRRSQLVTAQADLLVARGDVTGALALLDEAAAACERGELVLCALRLRKSAVELIPPDHPEHARRRAAAIAEARRLGITRWVDELSAPPAAR